MKPSNSGDNNTDNDNDNNNGIDNTRYKVQEWDTLVTTYYHVTPENLKKINMAPLNEEEDSTLQFWRDQIVIHLPNHIRRKPTMDFKLKSVDELRIAAILARELRDKGLICDEQIKTNSSNGECTINIIISSANWRVAPANKTMLQ